jgi:hypothetical protein
VIAADNGATGIKGSNNSVLVTGAGSLLTNSGIGIVVGFEGDGTLTVASGATVGAAAIILADNTNTTGTLNIGRFGSNDTAGNLIASQIYFATNGGVATLNFNQSNSTTIASTISGNGSVNQLGSGTTILTGYMTYAGVTTITNGTLQFGDGSTNPSGGSVVSIGSGNYVNNGTLVFAQYNGLTSTNLISGSGSVVQGSVGTTYFTADNTYSGGTVITNGFLKIGTGGASGSLGTGTVTMANSATLIYNRTNDFDVSNVIT